MRALLRVAIAVLCGCTSSHAAPPRTLPQETVRISGGGDQAISVTMAPGAAMHRGVVPFTVDKVLGALTAAYDSLRIPRSVDTAERTVGHTGFKLRRRLGTVPLSRFLECGYGQLVPNADSYEVYLSILTRVESGSDSGTTILSTTIDARARPIEFSGEYVRCGSKGVLEQQLVNAVKAALEAR